MGNFLVRTRNLYEHEKPSHVRDQTACFTSPNYVQQSVVALSLGYPLKMEV